MEKRDALGIYRSVRPKGFFPYSAWEIDNRPEIGPREVLVDVRILDIDIMCFQQLMEASYGDAAEISAEILRIVSERGKLHNSVTGTGGTMYGVVEKIGADYGNRYGIAVGDEICSLSSLTGTPLRLTKIKKIDFDMAQVHVSGKAVLFENSPVMKRVQGLSEAVQLSAVNTAGQAAETYRLTKKNYKVIVLGASGKMGIFCALAARKKLGASGRLVGIMDGDTGSIDPLIQNIYDERHNFEVNDIPKLRGGVGKLDRFDFVINCSDRPMTEPGCVMLARPGGTVFFAGWGGQSKVAGLAAETLGKDLNMAYYRGYVDNIRDFFAELAKDEALPAYVACGVRNDARYPWMQMLEQRNRLVTIAGGLLKDAKDYVFESPRSQEMLQVLLKVAQFDCNILITGETGAGKGIAAEIIHKRSNRGDKPFVKINCASIPEQLLESELFGYEGGAFTGSNPKGKKGLWETADGGVLFLDEIGEMSLLLQSKLLRALEENEIYRVGGRSPIRVDVRVIAATNQDLYRMVKEKKFREDLYYRLNVFYLRVPPLRERREDIGPLIDLMVHRYSKKFGIAKTFGREVKELMEKFPWEGNVRELENFIQKLFIASLGSEVTISDVTKQMTASHESILADEPTPPAPVAKRLMTEEEERELYRSYKEEYGSTRKMAQALGTSQSSVMRKLKKFRI
jgi:DNA-binding NtrC family response regulator/NADPH:quinone reductase-like Zn-dependent oxidoreductase